MASSSPRIGVSVSGSADLPRLGLVENHLRLALGEVARVVVRSGYTLVYGGHLRPDGYTAFLESEVDRYGETNRSLHLVVPWSEHRRMSLTELQAHREGLGLRARVTYLDQTGTKIDVRVGRDEEPAEVDDEAAALTALREQLTRETDARVLIGGKEDGFQGSRPGVIEEALLAIQANQPLYLAGGFGGATATVAAAAADLGARWPSADRGQELTELRQVIQDSGWSLEENGLSEDENRQLATTHRPSGIATLIALGLQRTFGD